MTMNLTMPLSDLIAAPSSEIAITEHVLASLAETPDPRLRTVLSSLVRHLHRFVRDVELRPDEWLYAIDYLTRTGQTCSETRQEFILLSDTLGISMLVDAVGHRAHDDATESTVLGPFYVANPAPLPLGADISGGIAGERLLVECTVSSSAGGGVAAATVDVWHSDSEGLYDVQKDDHATQGLRGRFQSDPEGRFHFWSILPSSYPIPDDGPVGEMLRASGRHPFRPAHIHFMISAPGHEPLTTQIFVAGDPYLTSDAVFGVKDSLIRDFSPQAEPPREDRDHRGAWRKMHHDFILTPRRPVASVAGR